MSVTPRGTREELIAHLFKRHPHHTLQELGRPRSSGAIRWRGRTRSEQKPLASRPYERARMTPCRFALLLAASEASRAAARASLWIVWLWALFGGPGAVAALVVGSDGRIHASKAATVSPPINDLSNLDTIRLRAIAHSSEATIAVKFILNCEPGHSEMRYSRALREQAARILGCSLKFFWEATAWL
jgi:hypothetical protein